MWSSTGAIPVSPTFLNWQISQSTPNTIACIQPVHLTLVGGDELTLVGATVGSDACSAPNPACRPYSQAPAVFTSCTPTSLFGRGPVYVNVDVNATITTAVLPVGCLRPFHVFIDVDGDGSHEIKRGPQYGFAGCP